VGQGLITIESSQSHSEQEVGCLMAENWVQRENVCKIVIHLTKSQGC
jgi:hypothetical protein